MKMDLLQKISSINNGHPSLSYTLCFWPSSAMTRETLLSLAYSFFTGRLLA